MADPAADAIREYVSRSYAERVRPLLEGGGAPKPCCGLDSSAESNTLEVIELTERAPSAGACCGADGGVDAQITNVARLYAGTDLSDLPSTVTDVAFGCGNPTAIAALEQGAVVLDLGSGGGVDCFLAAKMVGPEGRAIGVDMTAEMIALARLNATKLGATNVEFRQGEIEALPVDDASVDVVISNCVINLSPDKDAVFREAFRVLRPGGRLQVSDVVWRHEVPDDVRNDMERWAGCVAGALVEADYLAKVAAAGFTSVTSVAAEYPGGSGLASANVSAVKPS